ncbi:hypothetical protein EZ428_07600 [Pedobacter frigiditerrae]|uniref:DUF3575 domain-containing protein n=1 Tax=Pedobacter frigiditerrae TaxID=2530452 RepID=A0A4R0MWP4_9SPHI|nr:hypothetical protein [Pedobacter frigiditerrae]TCC91620.1 hypothetical protein EZ428_07600 [Pedobacter frigiditerrae]
MKKLILSGFLLATSFFAYAQKVDTSSNKKSGIGGNNELKLNLAYTIGGFPEINYERILKDDMSVGLAVMFGIEENPEFNFGIIPNFRVYFGGKKANGFFIEGNAAVISSDGYGSYYKYDYTTDVYTYYGDRTQTNFGLGAAAGAKFLTKNGFVGEIYLGAGRLFGANNADAYPRAGITIGKRF